jgi:hypothetical protein
MGGRGRAAADIGLAVRQLRYIVEGACLMMNFASVLLLPLVGPGTAEQHRSTGPV